ncbi:methylmalonyl-CoA decarboxylase [Poriferisphaera sp. WC338]|uniref:methylmalonyl-CoA decarboxylase n=1 Tax=Poriferisphaera sp. WC338 TaxID=3425129 RepID=UPI003D8191C5
MSLVELEIKNHIGTITMNDLRHRNCLSAALIDGILHALDACEKQHVRVVILRAHDDADVWSAGHDIREIPTDKQDPVTWNEPYGKLLRVIRHCRLPVICEIGGTVWGGACDLAVSSDLIVASTNVTFAITPAKLGLPYNTVGVAHFLHALPLHIIKEMFLTARPITAQAAHRFGLINRLVELEDLRAESIDLAEIVAANAPLCIRVLKTEMRMLADAFALAPDDYEHIQFLRRQTFRSQDFQEGLCAFHEKRSPDFQGK